ncbi:hypothetical protein Nekkels2_62 [Cellulophaga phage Nekkels_2]|nr:hypothetical protein Nekkels2_62 [Cellulophaga phage Nekkels_2]
MKIQKIKEIKEALDFMAKTGDVSKIALDSLITGLEELDEQFSVYDVVTSLLCVNSEGLSFITEGFEYNLIEESDTLYRITDDDGDVSYYDKKYFVKK